MLGIPDWLVRLGGRFLGIRPQTLAYLRAAAKLGRPASPEYPSELLPNAAHMFARGWMNRPFFETSRDWVWPYWAVRQHNPADPGFVPWGFQPYHLNLAYRDWTAIGVPGQRDEAIVDPRGLVTPWPDGWSLDTWLATPGRAIFPSQCPEETVTQWMEPYPVTVITLIRYLPWELRLQITMVEDKDGRPWVLHRVHVRHEGPEGVPATLFLAVRPFNVEGVSLIHDLEFRKGKFLVNGRLALCVPPPESAGCLPFREGDISHRLARLPEKTIAHCPAGLATGVAAYPLSPANVRAGWQLTALAPAGKAAKPAAYRVPVDGPSLLDSDSPASWMQRAKSRWDEAVSGAMRIELPDQRMQSAFEANQAYLLLMHDGESITPGPFTYHRFWFRDAAYLVHALDKMGLSEQAAQVLRSYPRRQRRDGYFVSQDGEWDANGQAIWTVVEHFRLTGDRNLLAELYPAVAHGARWIEAKRRDSKDGLLPAGFSAEHFGPPDNYYWDNFWALAGLRDATYAARTLGRDDDARAFQSAYRGFRRDVWRSLQRDEARLGQRIMPASPHRSPDAAMIGTLAACYPLRLLDATDDLLANTLNLLLGEHFIQGLFFQPFSHTALGTYLTLHAAHCLLYQKSADVWPLLEAFLGHASPTWTWAEGINPRSGHGGMGDGHHGWALADLLLLVRDLLLLEEEGRLLITPLLPAAWTKPGASIRVQNAPTHFGRISFEITFAEGEAQLQMENRFREEPVEVVWNAGRPIKAIEAQQSAHTKEGLLVLPGDCSRARVIFGGAQR